MSMPIRLLVLAELLTDGGTAKHLRELLPKLSRSGVEPVVWSRGEQGRYATELRAQGIEVQYRPALNRDLMLTALGQRFDLVHSYLYGPHLLDAVLARIKGIPYLKSTRNSGHWHTDSRSVRARVRLRTPLVRWHVVNSAGVADYLEIREKVKRTDVTVIHNGLEDRHAEPPRLARAALDLGEDDFVLIAVGWLKAHKQVDFLIKNLARLTRHNAAVKLLVVGDGPEEAALRTLAENLGIAEHCRFAGRRRDVHALLRLADVAVSASPTEGLSNAAVEAQMMAVPVVATYNAAGNRDIVGDGACGTLYPAGDGDAYCAAVAALFDTTLRTRMSAAARANFLDRFSAEQQTAAYLALYRRILGVPGS